MKIAISGAGIAGPTLAYWLHHSRLSPLAHTLAITARFAVFARSIAPGCSPL